MIITRVKYVLGQRFKERIESKRFEYSWQQTRAHRPHD